jgi:hypothetical protein
VTPRVLTAELRLGQQVRIQGTHQLINLIRTAFDGAGFAHLSVRHQRAGFL